MSERRLEVEFQCAKCGDVLGYADQGTFTNVPECRSCAEGESWPDKWTLLAVYGAPGNWPVEAA